MTLPRNIVLFAVGLTAVVALAAANMPGTGGDAVDLGSALPTGGNVSASSSGESNELPAGAIAAVVPEVGQPETTSLMGDVTRYSLIINNPLDVEATIYGHLNQIDGFPDSAKIVGMDTKVEILDDGTWYVQGVSAASQTWITIDVQN